MTWFWVQLSRVLLMLRFEQGGGCGVCVLLRGALSCVLMQIPALTINLWLDTRCGKCLHCWWNTGIRMLLQGKSSLHSGATARSRSPQSLEEKTFPAQFFFFSFEKPSSYWVLRDCCICFGALGNWLPLVWAREERTSVAESVALGAGSRQARPAAQWYSTVSRSHATGG